MYKVIKSILIFSLSVMIISCVQDDAVSSSDQKVVEEHLIEPVNTLKTSELISENGSLKSEDTIPSLESKESELVEVKYFQAEGVELFAHYFDIKTKQYGGSQVFGKINPKSNKDFLKSKQPEDSKFSIIGKNTSPFELRTEFDSQGRVFGVFYVRDGERTPSDEEQFEFSILYTGNNEKLAQIPVTIHVSKQTQWERFMEFYKPYALKESRLWGRKKFDDKELEEIINYIHSNDGKFPGTKIYEKDAYKLYKSYKTKVKKSELKHMAHEDAKENVYEYDLEDVCNSIGGLGYQYLTNTAYRTGSKNGERLKTAIYKAFIKLSEHLPVYPNDMLIDGEPLGTEVGDGFQYLSEHKILSHGIVTHQWVICDPLIVPGLAVMPELLKDKLNGDPMAEKCHEVMMKLQNIAFSIVPARREMNNPTQRWQAIANFDQSAGAWADGNIGHRYRGMMGIPIIFADYNRPITYVPLWYDDYFNGTEFEGITFARDWSPHGAVQDLKHFSSLARVRSKQYDQSGFHPDGTVTHHCPEQASDVALVTYGYEWLMCVKKVAGYFNGTPFELEPEAYDFVADNHTQVYRNMIFKSMMDFVVTGRAHFIDQREWVTKKMPETVDSLFKYRSKDADSNKQEELYDFIDKVKKGIDKVSGSIAFWVVDFLVHRESGEKEFYYSVKLKSKQTAGAEDFDKQKKTQHLGSGVFQLRVSGDEYGLPVLKNWDWHIVPGVTEEWKSGPLSNGHPGANTIAGQLSDGEYGISLYHHNTGYKEDSANAYKSYHLFDHYGVALGDSIRRVNVGEGKNIVTTIEQTEQKEDIHYNINGIKGKFNINEDVDKAFSIKSPSWLYHGGKGYLVIPTANTQLIVKSGDNIDRYLKSKKKKKKKSNDAEISLKLFAFVLDHGVEPQNEDYHYVQVAHPDIDKMDEVLSSYVKNVKVQVKDGHYHTLTNSMNKSYQFTAIQAGDIPFADKKIAVDGPAIFMAVKESDTYRLSFCDPEGDIERTHMKITVPFALKEGIYQYQAAGLNPFPAENVIVKEVEGGGSEITVELADSRDSEIYSRQHVLFASAPIVINIPVR